MARSGSSLRTVMKMAVLTRSGTGWSPAAAKGATSATASLRKCRSHRPMRAFQKPSTVHGVPAAKQMNRITSTRVQPPAPRTCAATISMAT